MAVIRPFRAWRYNEEVIRDIQRKFSPLFDVVNEEQLKQLYETPNNSIHLAVPTSIEDSLAKQNEWKENKIIRQDPLPGIYIYYQEFSLFGQNRKFVRKGFISMARISPDDETPESDIILHEGTITASVNERTKLLEKTLLNVAPTHGLYEDPEFELEALMDEYMEHPIYEHIDYQGVINKLAIVQDKKDIERFIQLMKQKKIYLADGHHRLASSITLRDKLKAEGSELVEDSMVNYHLIYLTNLCSDDLQILPIYRILRIPGRKFSSEVMLSRLDWYFDITEVTQHRRPVYEQVKERKHTFGMVLGARQFLLELKVRIDPTKKILLDLPDEVKKLDYTVLHYFVFDQILGIPYHEQPKSDYIEYQKEYSTALKRAIKNEDTLSFITPGLSMDDMMSVCKTGAKMPQKSTYFYPKVVCGLLFASIDDKENDTPFDASFKVAQTATATE